MIAITGANGNLGRATINFLLQKTKPQNIVAIVRNPDRVSDFKQLGVNIRQASYDDISALEIAFKGANQLVQISTTSVGQKGADEESNVVRSAIQAGISHIIYTSSVKPSQEAHFIASKQSIETENAILKSALTYTIFRNSLYMEAIPELLGDMMNEDEIFYPAGQGKVSFVSRIDIAEAIGEVCLSPNNHKNTTYEITGNKAYTFSELADLINAYKKNGVVFHDLSINDYKNELIKYQLPIDVIELLISIAKGVSNNEFAFVDNGLKTILGRDPLTLSEYLHQIV